ncbi:MAG: restriction endonuclease subunit S [Spirochaetia bacterium]|nr:restriction endonuclease subunit S [Spirochaetia bacterium]
MKSEIKQRIDQLKNGEKPNGYKKTDFGVFPYDWETDKSLGDLFDFYGGLSKSREELGEIGYPYLHYGDLHRGSFNKVSFEQYEQLPKCDINLTGKETCLMKDGDVAFLDASEDLEGTSRAVLIDNPDNKPFIAGLHIIYGKSKSVSITKWYKQYITSSESTKKQFQKLASGFKVYGLNRDTLSKIHVAYPKSTEEQSKIAEILMKWDKAIELQEILINRLISKERSVLQQCFAPERCDVTIRFADYIVEKNERNKGKNKRVKSISNSQGFIDQEEQFSKQVASENVSHYKIVKKNYVAYNPSRINVGSIAVYEEKEEGIISPMYTVFKCNSIDPKFFLLLLNTNRGKYEIKSRLAGSVRDTLAFDELKDIKMCVPNSTKWEKILNIFEMINKNIQLERDKLDILTLQRKALQQYLLNGIVRV